MNALARAGRAGAGIAALGWGLNLVALAVLLIVTVLLLYAIFRARRTETVLSEAGEEHARRWLIAGAVATACVLLVMFVWTLRVLTIYKSALPNTALTVRVTGYRYWWKLEYLTPSGAVDFTTANELHLPVATPVQLELEGGDVIHSFWVPTLAGKTDLVPGQTNRMWIDAAQPGAYRGVCAEFCGTQHAKMLITVFAQPTAEFNVWAARQRTAIRDTSAPSLAIFRAHGCAACHTLSGAGATGDAGPDLTHVASRATLAAGVMPNDPVALARWLMDPQSVKPGANMPDTQLRGADLATLAAYLSGLK